MPICITGMHRSGTSMVARLMNVAGLDLGPDQELMPAHASNPEGHWEHTRIVEINDQILSEFGGGWDCPPDLSGLSDRARVWRLEERAQAILREFAHSAFWGWKDPRNCLTLPFWQAQISDVKVVVCLRNPLEVTLSLHTRGVSSYELGLSLWAAYNESVIRATSPDQRVVTHYGRWFDDPAGEMRRISARLGFAVAADRLGAVGEVASRGLRHSQYSLADLITMGVSTRLIDQYEQLCVEAGVVEADGRPADRRRSRPMATVAPGLGSSDGEPVGLFDRTAFESQLLRAELKSRDTALRELQVQHQSDAERMREALAVANTMEVRLRELTDAGLQLEAKAARLATAVEKRDAVVAELNETIREKDAVLQVTSLRDRLAQVESELAAAREMAARLDEDLQGERRARSRLEEAARDSYEHLKGRLLKSMDQLIPKNATVLMVSRGDEALVGIPGRTVWHFPRTDAGVWAGQHPADSAAAIAHLERLRAKDARYLVLPATSRWWLDHYEEFRTHLGLYRMVLDREDTGTIIDVTEPAWQQRLRTAVAAFGKRFDREPAILDWDSGLGLAAVFQDHSVFSPPVPSSTLPYLDGSVDIVVCPNRLALVAEACRVATGMVATVSKTHSNSRRSEPMSGTRIRVSIEPIVPAAGPGARRRRSRTAAAQRASGPRVPGASSGRNRSM